MAYSSLVTYKKFSPSYGSRGGATIDTVTIHCMAGNLSVQSCGELFYQRSYCASSNYGVDSIGTIGVYVDEDYRSFCTSSRANDSRAITIEVANTKSSNPWPISDAAKESLIKLLVDICQRYPSIGTLKWRADSRLIGQVDVQNMTAHRWFAPKACPGDYIYNMLGDIASEVNHRLKEEDDMIGPNEFRRLYVDMMKDYNDNDASEWSQEARDWSIDNGLVKGGGSGEEFNGMWEANLTREQLVVMLHRYDQDLEKRLERMVEERIKQMLENSK